MTTVSWWTDDGALSVFVGAEPHRSVMVAQRGRLDDTRFVRTTLPGTADFTDAETVLVAAAPTEPIGSDR